MKARFLFAASLIVGTAAVAQQDMPAASPAAQPDSAGMASPSAPGAGSADTAAPPAAADTTGTAGSTASSDTSNYPPCSAAVHDRCVQTRELARKAGMPARHHSRSAHKR